MEPDDVNRRILVLNPVSGSQDHVDDIVELAADHDFEIRKTEAAGDARRLAQEAAPEADLVAAAGGDGTINEVIDGLASANALETTTLAVVPGGTGNNFATNIGLQGIEHAFEVIESGRRRKIDLGVANGRTFANSCVGGLTAEASNETSSEGKAEFGVLAYVMSTFETVRSFDSLPLRVTTAEGPSEAQAESWTGKAMFVLIGNCRRFVGRRTAQANVEDGLFEVTIIEDVSTVGLLGGAALERLFDRENEHVVRRRTPSLTIESLHGSVTYSLDGEMLETETLDLETKPAALEVAVGDEYRPDPGGDKRWTSDA